MEKLKSLLMNRIDLFNQLTKADEILLQIHQVGQLLKSAVYGGSMVLICGNGGSAAQAQHMAGEIVGRFLVERNGLPALALPADSVTLTALGNDYGYNEIFARQVTAFKDSAKLLFLLSTSGNSKNLLKAASIAKTYGIKTIGLLGRDGGALKKLCNFPIVVPSYSTPEIQEMHLAIIHILCQYVDGEQQ
ncbi:D-sedoheptulose-7-phosphate isomerase [Crassaminicella profunda]|uniref:D-sedoheptulose-7-phosphate isomerase n=1 Tax=Crassaminicella profunda TaxID=1286698 RepID=UPI001CA71487|nr:SIS domain-containing protein [Crassaminicella profunda]QZY55885.1 SIS domain-containing protein [Crassaminicella profunda]